MIEKRKFVLSKFITNYLFSIFMVVVNIIGFRLLFNIHISMNSIFIFFSVAIISILLGLFLGLIVSSRAILSNTILMLVMMMGFFGGALSLTSVLSNTKVMNILMYVSPLTIANKLIFKDLINISMGSGIFIWTLAVFTCTGLFIFFIGRRIKNGTVI